MVECVPEHWGEDHVVCWGTGNGWTGNGRFVGIARTYSIAS